MEATKKPLAIAIDLHVYLQCDGRNVTWCSDTAHLGDYLHGACAESVQNATNVSFVMRIGPFAGPRMNFTIQVIKGEANTKEWPLLADYSATLEAARHVCHYAAKDQQFRWLNSTLTIESVDNLNALVTGKDIEPGGVLMPDGYRNAVIVGDGGDAMLHPLMIALRNLDATPGGVVADVTMKDGTFYSAVECGIPADPENNDDFEIRDPDTHEVKRSMSCSDVRAVIIL